ncbi:hypothetical protein M426DRAFT_36164, partial [Hypoxylon sp. CI-4A]
LNVGWKAGWFDTYFSEKCVVMYGSQYGDLVDWEEGSAHRFDVLGFPRAQLVLEAQLIILTTLREVVDNILSGVDASLHHEVHDHFWWQWLKDELQHVVDLQGQLRDSIRQGQPLPPSYRHALGCLRFLLHHVVRYFSIRLEKKIADSPGFHHGWEETNVAWAKYDYLRINPIQTKQAFDEDPLEWCLTQLPMESVENHAMLFAFLQDYLSQCNYAEERRMDESLLRCISDLSAVHEMCRAVILSRPQHECLTWEELEEQLGKDRSGWKCATRPGKEDDTSPESLRKSAVDLIQEFYLKPPSGPRNAEWVQRSKTNRRILKAFW